MAKYKKLYEKIVRNPKDVDFEELDKLLRLYGFICRQPRKGSSHYTYYHPRLEEILTIPKNRPVKAVYVRKALEAIKNLESGGEEE